MEGDDKEGLQIVPVPALVAILLNREEEKGAPLTEEEVCYTRDNCECIAMPSYALDEINRKRGYNDIDPANVWEEWCIARKDLLDDRDP